MSSTFLLTMAGLPGSGKTTLAEALAPRLNAVLLNKDQLRSALFSPEDVEYSAKQDDLCFSMLLQAADFMLEKGRNVILDGRPFVAAEQWVPVEALAVRKNVPLRILLCTCREQTSLQRIQAQSETHPAGNRSADLYHRIKESFQRPTLPHLEVDTDQSLEICVKNAMDYFGNEQVSF